MNTRLLRRIWPLVASNLLMLVVAVLCTSAVSSLRALASGESLWSKAQRDAVDYLREFGRTGDPVAYAQFLAALDIPLGDRQARDELEKPAPNWQVAATGLINGGNHPDDVPGMMRVLRLGSVVSYVRHALDVWGQADELVVRLRDTGDELSKAVEAGAAGQARREQLLGRVDALDSAMRPLEDEFGATVGDASRATTWFLAIVAAASSALFLALGIVLTRGILRRGDAVVSELRSAQARILAELQRKNSVLITQQETALDAILLVDENGKIVSYNRRFVELWSLPESLVRARDDEPVLRSVVAQMADPEAFLEKVQYLYEHMHETSRDVFRTKDGRTIDRFTAPVISASGESFGRVWYFRDITEREKAENTLRKSNRALLVLGAVNHARVLGESERTLLSLVCAALLDPGGYRMAWIGFVEHDEHKSIRPVAKRGIDDGYLDRLEITWADTERGRGPAGEAVRTGTAQFSRDIATDPRMLAWRADALSRGYASAATLPLLDRDEVFGILAVYSKEAGAFDEEEVSLLKEIAADLAFGILTHRSNQERRRAEARAEHLANFDAVTGLPNRIQFLAQLEKALAYARANHEQVAVMTLGVDRLAEIQEDVDLARVDELLKKLAARLVMIGGRSNLLGRIGGDSFALIVPRADVEVAHAIAIKVQLAMGDPLETAGVPIDLQVTNGVVLFPDHGSNAEDLLRLGEMTARHARAQGASYSIYSGKEETETPYRLSLLAELRVALRDDALALYYQPKVDIKSGRVTAVEALLRWPHPVRGMVPPNHFIPLAEHTGLIKNVTRWVLDAAVRRVEQWHAAGLAIPIAINVSPNNLRDPEFIDRLVTLRTAGVRLDMLQLEITETALMQDLEKSREVLIRIRDLGIQIFLDDFGTGFSSLSYIATLPIHALKIDRSFIIHMMHEERHRAVVAASVSLAHSLGMKVVAEGVETHEQARTVTEHGCDEIQGYLVSKPLPEDQFLRWHAAFAARPFAVV